jgi:hypothetical protein
MLEMFDRSVVIWLVACFGHAWWDAWFGIEFFNEYRKSYKGQHFLGGMLSLIWFALFMLIFDFNLTLRNFGWLMIGLSIAGIGCGLFKNIYHKFTKIRLNTSDKVEWWFRIFVPIKTMNIINLSIFLFGIFLIILDNPSLTA